MRDIRAALEAIVVMVVVIAAASVVFVSCAGTPDEWAGAWVAMGILVVGVIGCLVV
jgi:hypothetical protein